MNNFFNRLRNFIKDNKGTVAIVILSLLFILSVIFSINQYVAKKNAVKAGNNNIVALTDSIRFYQSKCGDMVAEKTLLLGDMNTLRLANKELSDKIEKMKINKPQQVVYVETVVTNEVHDTAWIVNPNDTLVCNTFDFSNKWRKLSGNIKMQKGELSMSVDNDKVFVNYTLAIKDNKVYVTSENPYVTYEDIQGLTLPKQRKNFSIGVGLGTSYGYDVLHKGFVPSVGISFGVYYNLFQF